ncbi:MAG: hypothetical protein AB8B99_14705 [Phormidesmis sp.]
MTSNSNRPVPNTPEPNSPEPIQPDFSGSLSQPGANAANGQSSGAPSHNGYSATSPTTSAPASQSPVGSSSQPTTSPPAKEASASAFNVSQVRQTTPNRTTPVKKSAKKSVASKFKPKSGMPVRSVQARIPLFFTVGIGLSLLAGGLKAIAAGLSEGYLYSLPWMGGFLRSIELAEISNLVVFAFLAGGIGAATIWLPRQWNAWAKIGLLLAVSPFVFSASYVMQQRLWVQQVAERSNISYPEAQKLTNDFLKRQTGSGGFFGFYPYSTEVAELPTSRASLEKQSSSNPSQLLTKELSSYNDPRADLVAFVFERVGWLLRFMYMAIAALTSLIYYFKGREWVDARRSASYENGSEPNAPSGQSRPRT